MSPYCESANVIPWFCLSKVISNNINYRGYLVPFPLVLSAGLFPSVPSSLYIWEAALLDVINAFVYRIKQLYWKMIVLCETLMIKLVTYYVLLTIHSMAPDLFWKLLGQQVKKVPAFVRTRKLITVFGKAHHWTWSWYSLLQSSYILIL